MEINGIGAIAEVSIGLAGFAGVFIALTQKGSFAPPEQVRLSFLLYTSLGALFLALLPHVFFAGIMSDAMAWRVLGLLAVAHTAYLLTYLARALDLKREYAALFPIRVVVWQGTQIVASLILAVCVLVAPMEAKASFYVATLVVLLAQAALVFARLLFHRGQ